jgi:CheY-like chemotaxis protein
MRTGPGRNRGEAEAFHLSRDTRWSKTPDTAEMFRVFLNQLCDDFDVHSFQNGPAFLETLQPSLYCAIILDISLPGMDGFEVLRRTRSIDPTIPAIALTAHAGQNYRQRAVEAGFNDFVTKPIHDLEAFCRMVIKTGEASAA